MTLTEQPLVLSPTDDPLREHFTALARTAGQLEAYAPLLRAWARQLAELYARDGRLLACGNGGSAAEAQHLTGELVGRFRGERRALSAIALHADTSATTAILNDYGTEEVYARPVRAHGRPGDVLVAFSTSGSSANVLSAAHAARDLGVAVWALTGPAPNPLAALADAAIAVDAPTTATVQELHLSLVHGLCLALDAELGGPW